MNDGYRNIVYPAERKAEKVDGSWALLQATVRSTDVPTWKALNSKITSPTGITTTAVLPLIKSPPTHLGTLLAAMLRCQMVSSITAPNKRTIITVDLQLYIKAIQLISSRPELKDKFIIRIGELHEVFAQCKAIGKYIEGSGLDAIFTHLDIYGPNTLAKILEGKHC